MFKKKNSDSCGAGQNKSQKTIQKRWHSVPLIYVIMPHLDRLSRENFHKGDLCKH